MGYYSALAIKDIHNDDCSYPSPDIQILWRMEDLQSRLEDVMAYRYGSPALYFMGYRFSNEDLSYAPPEDFYQVSDILAAISIANERLALLGGEESRIRPREANTATNEEISGQLSFGDSFQEDACFSAQTGEFNQAA